MENIAVNHPEGMQSAAEQMSDHQMVKQVSLGGKTTDQTAQFFYALIAMACLYGCFSGYGTALYLQANLTALAARRCVTPTHKLKTHTFGNDDFLSYAFCGYYYTAGFICGMY